MSSENAWFTKIRTPTKQPVPGNIEDAILAVIGDNFLPIKAVSASLMSQYPQFNETLEDDEEFLQILGDMKDRGILDKSAYGNGMVMRPQQDFGKPYIPAKTTQTATGNYG